MRLNDLIIVAGDIIAHGIATVVGIDAINNTVQGNYKVATVEAIISTGIEISKYLDKRKQNIIADFQEKVPIYVAEANRINQQSNEAFQRLSKKIDSYQE